MKTVTMGQGVGGLSPAITLSRASIPRSRVATAANAATASGRALSTRAGCRKLEVLVFRIREARGTLGIGYPTAAAI